SLNTQDATTELGFEMVFDLTNLFGAFKLGSRMKGAFTSAKLVREGLQAATTTDKIINRIVSNKLTDYMIQTQVGRVFKARSVYSISMKRGQAVTTMIGSVLMGAPLNKQAFIAKVADISSYTKELIDAGADVAKRSQVASKMVAAFYGQAPVRVQNQLLDLAKVIPVEDWVHLADKAYDDALEGIIEIETKKILKSYEGKADLQDVVVKNKINAAVDKSMRSISGKQKMAESFGNLFKERSLTKNSVRLGGKSVLNDTIASMIGNSALGDTTIGKILGTLEGINTKFMKAWVWATLARRPAWMLYNFTDNMFRYVFSGGGMQRNMKDIVTMLSSTRYMDDLMRSGVIPAELGGTFLRDFINVTEGEFTTRGQKAAILLDTGAYPPNPLKWMSHYRSIYTQMSAKSIGGKIWNGFKAWPASIKSLNQSIEVGMKTMMYLKFYDINLGRMNKIAVQNVQRELAERLAKANIDPALAEQVSTHVAQAWATAGSNIPKLSDLIKLEQKTPGMGGYSIYLPNVLRDAKWFDEEEQRLFVYAVSDKFSSYVKGLANDGVTKVQPKHIDDFFDEMVRVIDGEAKSRVMGMQDNLNLINSIDINTAAGGYKSAVYTPNKSVVDDVSPEARAFITENDIDSMSSKQKKNLRKILKSMGFKFDDTEEGLKDGFRKLQKKMDDYEASKPKPLTDEEITNLSKTLGDDAVKNEADVINSVKGRADISQWDIVSSDMAKTFGVLKGGEWKAPYSTLKKETVEQIGIIARDQVERVSNFGARINEFWRQVVPGPQTASKDVYRGKMWDNYWDMLAHQLENRHMFLVGDVYTPLVNGTFDTTKLLTPKQMFEMSNISVAYDENGLINKVIVSTTDGKVLEEVSDTIRVGEFTKLTGVRTQADVDAPIKIIDSEMRMTEKQRKNLEYKLAPAAPQSYDDMVKADLRLDLAIREG
ncbi:MAG: hypothetical protein WCY09_10270, partial [Candidatus Omnitrophota bacterium]